MVEIAILINYVAALLPVDVKAMNALNMHGVSNDSGNDCTVASLRKNPIEHKRALINEKLYRNSPFQT